MHHVTMKSPLLYLRNQFFLQLSACLVFSVSMAQSSATLDTNLIPAPKKGLLDKYVKSLSINNPEPEIAKNGVLKNESAFTPFKGKIIRNITVEKIGFSRFVNDTTKKTKNIFNDIGETLHTKTSNSVVFNNLFFTKGDTLYPGLLADNETFLRQISYLQDARILVKPSENGTDSVDVIILCKDVFPIGGSMDEGTTKKVSFEINDDNLFGTGNRIQIQNYFDVDRKPNYGFGFQFLKRNIRGSFINLAIGYQNQAPAYNSGIRQEEGIYLMGELPLVSPYHSWTGAFEIATHKTNDLYNTDSIYNSILKYNYRLFDGWLGYNIGAKKQLQQNFKSRLRKIMAIRGIHRNYFTVPDLYKEIFKIDYANLVSVLGSYTIFEQDYYHTNFIYGFGRNEDVPEGFNLTFTGGWTMLNNFSRPYLGFEYQRNYFSNRFGYLNYKLKLGSYYRDNSLEDVSILSSLEYFTKLRKLGNSKWYLRHFLNGSITHLFNSFLNETLRLGSDYGIPQLSNPFIKASSRITFNAESVFYNTWKLIGFSFAPFGFTNISYLKPMGGHISEGDIYTAIGGGIRTRNENLTFGTLECKAYYYPRVTGAMNQWNITFNTGLQFRYTSQLVKKPDFVLNN